MTKRTELPDTTSIPTLGSTNLIDFIEASLSISESDIDEDNSEPLDNSPVAEQANQADVHFDDHFRDLGYTLDPALLDGYNLTLYNHLKQTLRFGEASIKFITLLESGRDLPIPTSLPITLPNLYWNWVKGLSNTFNDVECLPTILIIGSLMKERIEDVQGLTRSLNIQAENMDRLAHKIQSSLFDWALKYPTLINVAHNRTPKLESAEELGDRLTYNGMIELARGYTTVTVDVEPRLSQKFYKIIANKELEETLSLFHLVYSNSPDMGEVTFRKECIKRLTHTVGIVAELERIHAKIEELLPRLEASAAINLHRIKQLIG